MDEINSEEFETTRAKLKAQLAQIKQEAADAESRYQQLRRDTAIADSLRNAGAGCSDDFAQSLLNTLIGDTSELEIPSKMDEILKNPTYKQIFAAGQQQQNQSNAANAAEIKPQKQRFSRADLLKGRVRNAIDLIARGQADVF